ncbi:hypothetical protein HYV84_04825 [Candidatus Woesearchaeota archaeon]|nr:hypothetical protein [Candidatus Woesearchaeota archaeon]
MGREYLYSQKQRNSLRISCSRNALHFFECNHSIWSSTVAEANQSATKKNPQIFCWWLAQKPHPEWLHARKNSIGIFGAPEILRDFSGLRNPTERPKGESSVPVRSERRESSVPVASQRRESSVPVASQRRASNPPFLDWGCRISFEDIKLHSLCLARPMFFWFLVQGHLLGDFIPLDCLRTADVIGAEGLTCSQNWFLRKETLK